MEPVKSELIMIGLEPADGMQLPLWLSVSGLASCICVDRPVVRAPLEKVPCTYFPHGSCAWFQAGPLVTDTIDYPLDLLDSSPVFVTQATGSIETKPLRRE